MRGFLRAGLICLILTIFFLPCVGAWNVTNVSIEPSGAMTPGTPVIVSVKIDFSQQLFDSHHTLQYSTELEKALWDPDLIADGVEYPNFVQSGKTNTLSGIDLSDHRLSTVRLTLEGIAPSVKQSTNITILRLEERDENRNIVGGSIFCRNTTIVYTGCCISPLFDKQADLRTFRTHIAEKAAIGVDTAQAEENYRDAEQRINLSMTRESAGQKATDEDIQTINKAITEGERLLDKAWAEKEVQNAQTPIENVDAIIAWFKGNLSTADTLELQPIVAKRNIAMGYISTANDKIAMGNYAQAREMAREAYAKGNESYDEILNCKRVISNSQCSLCMNPVAPLIIPGVYLVIIILLIAGIFWWKKKKSRGIQ